MNELALFAGAGGGILGGHLLGWRTVCAVEYAPYAAGVLLARQNDGILPPFPVWDDVRTFDGKPWRGIVDVISGGFPCQDISAAGGGKGIDGERSGLWREMARIVGEVLPQFVFVENSPLLVGRGAALVIGDLAALGYDCEWCCISASDLGAPHQRDRFWLVGTNTNSFRCDWEGQSAKGHEPGERRQARCKSASLCLDVADTNSSRLQEREILRESKSSPGFPFQGKAAQRTNRWPTEPDVGRVANGVAARVDRLKALGNGQVPRVAATAFSLLAERNQKS